MRTNSSHVVTVGFGLVLTMLTACGGGGSAKPANSNSSGVAGSLGSASQISQAPSSVSSQMSSSLSMTSSSLSLSSMSSKTSSMTSSSKSSAKSSSSVSSNNSSQGNVSSSAPIVTPGDTGFPATPIKVMPGTTAAALGNPSSTKVNGIKTVLDTLHHMPKHAIPATWASLPSQLTGLPSISDIAILNRGDAAIIYVPAVKDAADYRAYIVGSNVTFAGSQPRNAVVACAGYRQRFARNVNQVIPGASSNPLARELIQAIEVPGLIADGNYTIIVEALSTPCPFPGVMSHTSATIPLFGSTRTFEYRSFNDIKTLYGNEILNGQGSALNDYTVSKENGAIPAEELGHPVAPNDPRAPADPQVIARSAIVITRPAADESENAPIFDVGPNSLFEDFASDGIMTGFTASPRSQGAGLSVHGQFKDWFFWTMRIQPAVNDSPTNPKAIQVWQRHGRLYTTIADNAQDVMGGIYFASTKNLPQQLDASKYVHSMFRIDSGATNRRYWHWLMCGSDTVEDLVDPATRIPRVEPVGTGFFQDPGGHNPSANHDFPEEIPESSYHKKECLGIAQIGGAWIFGTPPDAGPGWFDAPHSNLHAMIHPAGLRKGVINLKPAGIPDGDTNAQGGMGWRLDADKHPTSPMFEPFDQMAPLTHYDIFVRPDRVIFYVNGRQAWCGDLSERPLTMKYGVIAYGNVLYHSGAENSEAYVGGSGGAFHYIMNTSWADTRIWDVVAHSQQIDIPRQFAFNPATCFKPASTEVR
jgi:hypothetical protein